MGACRASQAACSLRPHALAGAGRAGRGRTIVVLPHALLSVNSGPQGAPARSLLSLPWTLALCAQAQDVTRSLLSATMLGHPSPSSPCGAGGPTPSNTDPMVQTPLRAVGKRQNRSKRKPSAAACVGEDPEEVQRKPGSPPQTPDVPSLSPCCDPPHPSQRRKLSCPLLCNWTGTWNYWRGLLPSRTRLELWLGGKGGVRKNGKDSKSSL